MEQPSGTLPSFLSLSVQGKKNPTGEQASRKRKTPHSDPKAKKVVAVEKPASTPARKSVAITPAPPSALPTSSSALPPGLCKHALWRTGVSGDLRDVIIPPSYYFSTAPLSEDQIEELGALESHSLKMASLARAVLSLKNKLAKAIQDGNTAQEGKEKTYEELLLVKEELKSVKTKNLSLEQVNATNVQSLQHCKAEIETGELKLKTVQDELKAVEDNFSDCRDELSRYKVELDKSIQGSFDNALNQIKVLNPDLQLNTTGLDAFSYVLNGKITPLIAIAVESPATNSVTQIEDAPTEAGEEVLQAAVEPNIETTPAVENVPE